MTREEAIDILDDNFTAIDTHGHYTDEEVEQARQMAIKALKQQDVLDKIRAEIEQERIGYPPSADYRKAIMKCLQIIDKYKAESEG